MTKLLQIALLSFGLLKLLEIENCLSTRNWPQHRGHVEVYFDFKESDVHNFVNCHFIIYIEFGFTREIFEFFIHCVGNKTREFKMLKNTYDHTI